MGEIIFQLSDFNTKADIVDRGPLHVPVVAGSTITVGSDADGKFMNFPGGTWNSVVTMGSTLLNCKEIEISILAKDILNTGGGYGALLFDNRPVNTNGNYVLFGPNTRGDSFREFTANVNNQALTVNDTKIPANAKAEIRLTMYKDKTELILNSRLISTNRAPGVLTSFIGNNAGIGRHGFASVSGVMPLIAKIYNFTMRKIS